MKVLLISAEVFWDSNADCPYVGLPEALEQVSHANHVVLVSNRSNFPPWLRNYPFIRPFQCIPARESGHVVEQLAAIVGTNKPGDYLALGTSVRDFRMAANAQILLICCNWTQNQDNDVKKYGVPFAFPSVIPKIINLLSAQKPWFFEHKTDYVDYYALTNAGTLRGVGIEEKQLIEKLNGCLKSGDKQGQKAFLLHLMSSILSVPGFREVDYWEIWPGSQSRNDHTEVMDYFAKYLRYVFKKKAMHKPLFIRHQKTLKRHSIRDEAYRTDPADQLKTIYINPEFRGKIRDKTFVVLDDYLTYGLSFGVSSALLLREGAKKVICIAMGKFGMQARRYTFQITAKDLYGPFKEFQKGTNEYLNGSHYDQANLEFVEKFRAIR